MVPVGSGHSVKWALEAGGARFRAGDWFVASENLGLAEAPLSDEALCTLCGAQLKIALIVEITR